MTSEDKQWNDWKIKFGKSYDTSEEEMRRKELWNKTKKMVEEHNEKYAKGETTFEMGLNHFADLEEHERRGYCGLLRNKTGDK